MQLPSLAIARPTTPAALVPPAFAALAVLGGGLLLPFYPSGWPYALAALVAALTFSTPRLALALALAVPVLPLGNLALGLALVYAVLAAGWLALMWRDARRGLLFVGGPLLLPFGLIALLPLVVQPARGPFRRAAHVVAGVLVATLVAGLGGHELPFGGGVAEPFGLAESESPLRVAGGLLGAAPTAVALEALALAAVAVAIPYVRGLWAAAGLGAAMVAALLLLAPAAPALPLVAAAWVTCGSLIFLRIARSQAQ